MWAQSNSGRGLGLSSGKSIVVFSCTGNHSGTLLPSHCLQGARCLLLPINQPAFLLVSASWQVLLALGGRARLERKLRGRMRLSWQYSWRLAGVEATHAAHPFMLAYQNADLPYAWLTGG